MKRGLPTDGESANQNPGGPMDGAAQMARQMNSF